MAARKKSRNQCLQSQLRKRSGSDISVEIRNRRRSLDEFLGFYNQLVNKDRSLSLNGRRTSAEADSDSEFGHLGNAVRGCLKMLRFTEIKKNSQQSRIDTDMSAKDQKTKNQWTRTIEYLMSEHPILFEIMLWMPLILMIFYILFIEEGPLITSHN